MTRGLRAFILPVALIASALLAGAAPAAADQPLLATDSFVVVAVPAPGHSNEWELTAVNSSDGPVAVSALVTSVEGDVFAGSHPLSLVATAPDRTELAIPDQGSTGASTTLGTVQPGERIVVSGAVSLPRDAGDEYQGLSGSLTIRLIGEDVSPPESGGFLATTGVDVLGTAAIAAGLLAGGLLLFAARRCRRREDDATSPSV